jgi:hypothetical protein
MPHVKAFCKPISTNGGMAFDQPHQSLLLQTNAFGLQNLFFCDSHIDNV